MVMVGRVEKEDARIYMKITFGALSIVSLASIILLAGCESIQSIHIPNLLSSEDEVPDEVKDQPRFVEIPLTPEEEAAWPRLGDVPFKPKDFSTPSAYNKTMNELKQDRVEAEAAKNNVLSENYAPVSAAGAPQADPGQPFIPPPVFLKK